MKIKFVLLGVIIGVVLLMFLVFGAKLIYEKPNYENYCDYQKINEKNDTAIQAQMYGECAENYDSATEIYSKKMFILSLIVSLIVIAGSAIFININSISGGLMFGGLMFLIYGTASYWNYMNDLWRFVILGIALGVLIYVGYFLGKRERNKSKRIKRK